MTFTTFRLLQEVYFLRMRGFMRSPLPRAIGFATEANRNRSLYNTKILRVFQQIV